MQFEEAVGCLPDASVPVAEQLEQAVTTIKRNVKLILDTKAQMEVCKKVDFTAGLRLYAASSATVTLFCFLLTGCIV